MSLPVPAVMLTKEGRAGAGSKDTKGGFGSFFLMTHKNG